MDNNKCPACGSGILKYKTTDSMINYFYCKCGHFGFKEELEWQKSSSQKDFQREDDLKQIYLKSNRHGTFMPSL